jgi:uncharacterized protein YeaO (DUF488 family)
MFKVHLANRVANTRLSLAKGMIPIFEAIMNSAHAIQERRIAGGRVDVYLKRGQALSESIPAAITDVTVIDDGIGFTEANFESFATADSVYKSDLGGKGIGRLMYLKVFDRVEISSNYLDGVQWTRRTFGFQRTEGGITELSVQPSDAKNYETTVKLRGIQPPFEKSVPVDFDSFCDRTLEHLLVLFLSDAGIPVFLHDEGKPTCDLLELAKQVVSDSVEETTIRIETFDFKCSLIKLYLAKDAGHRIVLCAHGREVSKEKLSNYLPDLTKKLADGRGEYVVAAYVQGVFLDQRVNQERTEIHFDEDEHSFFGTVTNKRLFDAIVERVEAFAKAELKIARDEKLKQIQDHAEQLGPEYRPLLKPEHAELLRDIPPGLTSEKLEAELHKRLYAYEARVKTKANDLKATLAKDPTKYKELRTRYREVLSEQNELGRAKLADYVVHRKVILELFEQAIGRQEDGKYSLEEYVHDIIVPLGVTSDDISNRAMNLWLIDERLAFHSYLGSDKPLSSAPNLDIASKKEPDVLVFNKAMAMTASEQPYSSMVVVEFKRPMRSGYASSEEDPIEQVYEYVRKIRGSKAIDARGRPVGGEQVPIYAYVVCDFTERVRHFCEDKVFSPTPDGMGYVGMNPKLNTFVEVLSYTKVLVDAKKRNHAFFERLSLV